MAPRVAVPLVVCLMFASACGARSAQPLPSSAGSQRASLAPTAPAPASPVSPSFTPPAPPGPQLQGYLATGTDWAYFISWTRSGGAAQGSIYYAASAGGGDPTEQAGTSSLTATISGSNVSVTFDNLVLGGVSQFQGTVTGDTLTIEVPQQDGSLAPLVFSKGSQADYNAAVTQIKAVIAGSDQAYQTQQQLQKNAQAAQHALKALNSALQDAATFGSWTKDNPPFFGQVLAAYADSWAKMQADWHTEQVDFATATTGADCGRVGADAGQIGADDGSIGADDGGFGARDATLTPLGDEQQVADSIQGLYHAVLTAAKAPGAGIAVPAAATIQKDLAAANAGIAAYAATMDAVQKRVSHYDSEAQQLDQQASALADKCNY